MDQNRRDAAAWAKEWQIRQKNRRLLMALALLLLIAAIGFIVHFTIVHVERTTFGSVEEMRKAMQGRYVIDSQFEEMVIEGDDVTHTFLAYSHYNRDYAEKYGYNYDEQDAVYEDSVVEWDYRNGVIKTHWMGNIVVDKNGNLWRKDYYGTYEKTNEPRPEPIDPSTLNNPEGDIDADIPVEEQEEFEEREERIESTEDAAEDAETEGNSDEQP